MSNHNHASYQPCNGKCPGRTPANQVFLDVPVNGSDGIQSIQPVSMQQSYWGILSFCTELANRVALLETWKLEMIEWKVKAETRIAELEKRLLATDVPEFDEKGKP